MFDPDGDLKAQAQEIATTLCKRIIEDKRSAREAEGAENIEEPVLPGIL